MAYKLKTTGQALDLVACLVVDEDGSIVDLCGNEISVHANVSVGTAAWKGVNRKFFETKGSTYYPYGIAWSGTKPVVQAGSEGFTLFGALAGSGVGSNLRSLIDIGGTTGNGTGLTRWANGGLVRMRVVGSNEGDKYNTTPIPIDNTTPFSIAWVYKSSTNTQPFYGLASGVLGTDGPAVTPTEVSPPASIVINSVGGAGATQGYQNHKAHMWAVFKGQRTLTQLQALHNNWFTELIADPTSVVFPSTPSIKLTTEVTATSARINWVDNSAIETGYAVELEDASNPGVWPAIPGSPFAAGSTSAVATGLTSGKTYTPRVMALGTDGNSNWSVGQSFVAGSSLVRKIRWVCHADMIGQTGIKGFVLEAPNGSELAGPKIANFSGASAVASGSDAEVKVPVAPLGISVTVGTDLRVVYQSSELGSASAQVATVIEE